MVRDAARQLLQNRQGGSAAARVEAHRSGVSDVVTDQGHGIVVQIGDDDSSLFAVARRPARVVHDFDDVVHDEHVPAARPALAGDRSDLPGTVVVVRLRAEPLLDLLPHEVTQHFRRGMEKSRPWQAHSVLPGRPRHLVQRAGVSGHVMRAPRSQPLDVLQPASVVRHLERIEQQAVLQVAPDPLAPRLHRREVAVGPPEPGVPHGVSLHAQELAKIVLLRRLGLERVRGVLDQDHRPARRAPGRVFISGRRRSGALQRGELPADDVLRQYRQALEFPGLRQEPRVVFVVAGGERKQLSEAGAGRGEGVRAGHFADGFVDVPVTPPHQRLKQTKLQLRGALTPSHPAIPPESRIRDRTIGSAASVRRRPGFPLPSVTTREPPAGSSRAGIRSAAGAPSTDRNR